MIQVGVAWVDKDTSINELKDTIQTKSFCFDYATVDFEERCWCEFWSKQQAGYKRITAEAKEPAQQWKDFIAFWDQLPEDIIVVSDNPAYDLEALDYHVWTEAKRLPLRYSRSGKYRSVQNPGDQDKAIPKKDKLKLNEEASGVVKHDHWAE